MSAWRSEKAADGKLRDRVAEGGFSVTVLDGVTGSSVPARKWDREFKSGLLHRRVQRTPLLLRDSPSGVARRVKV